MRKYLIMLLLLIPLVYSLEECGPVILTTEIPCQVTSTWNYTTCRLNVTVVDSFGINIINYTPANLPNTQLCFFNWTVSEPGSYTHIADNQDTGNITVERENNMIAVIITFIALIIYFIVIGLVNNGFAMKFASWGLALIEMILMIGVLYVNEAGFEITNLLRINFLFIGIIGFGIGMISLFALSVRTALPTEEIDTEEDGRKWHREKWS